MAGDDEHKILAKGSCSASRVKSGAGWQAGRFKVGAVIGSRRRVNRV